MVDEFIDIEYLRKGSRKQKWAYDTIKGLRVMDILKKYTPILAGTIPIGIDIESSDLDIICEVHNFEEFKEVLINEFSNLSGFTIETVLIDGNHTTICNFKYGEFLFEIFGQPIKSIYQNAYRHMLVEDRILKVVGEKGKEKIIELKRNGYKTEPAFGIYLNITENPYELLLLMHDWSENQLKDYLRNVIGIGNL